MSRFLAGLFSGAALTAGAFMLWTTGTEDVRDENSVILPPPPGTVPLDAVHPSVVTNDQMFSFSNFNHFDISDETRPWHDRRLTLSYETNLATIQPDDVELVCLVTYPYENGIHRLGAQFFLTQDGHNKLKDGLRLGKDQVLEFKFEGQRIYRFTTNDTATQDYIETRDDEIPADISPLRRRSDFDLTADDNNHLALMALVSHLSPGKVPGGCTPSDDPTKQSWWAETVKRMW